LCGPDSSRKARFDDLATTMVGLWTKRVHWGKTPASMEIGEREGA
jgi:hypothetical protein